MGPLGPSGLCSFHWLGFAGEEGTVFLSGAGTPQGLAGGQGQTRGQPALPPDSLRDVLPACPPSTCQPSLAGTCLSRLWLLPTASTSR